MLDLDSLVHSALPRVVALEPDANGSMRVFQRGTDGALTSQTLPFHPWFLTDSRELSELLSVPHDTRELTGTGRYRFRVSFENGTFYDDAVKEMKLLTGFSAGAPNAPYRVFSDKQFQFLAQYPARLFSGMHFDEVRRLQLDIETRASGEPHFPDPTIRGDEVILVSLKDSSGFEICLANEGDEAELLRKMVQVIQERDPDVLEGYNLFDFDLNYLKIRCKMRKVPFAIGRDGSAPRTRSSQMKIGEQEIRYQRFDVYGRHVVDLLHLVKLHDQVHRDMDSHGLKAAARYFHVVPANRTYVPGGEITAVFDSDPERLKEYCLDDVRETDGISRLLSPSYFYQACLIPLSYQNVVVKGNASRIDLMLCAEYLIHDAALPMPAYQQSFQGALTSGERQGVFSRVWHVDVRSLYPSIIAAENLSPAGDTRREFLRLLKGLRQFRLEAKDAKRNAPEKEKNYFESLQSTFKILINSFYGYTGFVFGTFNDYEMAAAITARGRQILSGMRDFLESIHATVIEMDTDGIYFQPPETIAPEEMQKCIQGILPQGIEVELDAVYQAMFGYKSKNYALLLEDGSVTLAGAALKSRGLEPFQRRYIRELVTLLLHGRFSETEPLFQKYLADLEHRVLPLEDLAQKEILSQDPKNYAEKVVSKKAKRSAPYDLAIASGRAYRQGDSVLFYVTGEKKSVSVVENSRLLADAVPGIRDENIPYYQNKLTLLHQKLMEAARGSQSMPSL